MNITINFLNDNRSLTIDKQLIDKYKLSMIYAHFDVFPDTDKIELDVKYDDFLPVYDMLLGKIKQWELPVISRLIAHNMGLLCDKIDAIHKTFVDEYQKKLVKIQRFLNCDDVLLIADGSDEYFNYKNTFSDMANIIPVQIITQEWTDSMEFISIYSGIPIYVNVVSKPKTYLDDHNIIMDGNINVNEIKRKMLFTGHRNDELGGNVDVYNNYQKLDKKGLYESNEIIFLYDVMAWFVILQSDRYHEYFEDHDLHNVAPIFFNNMPKSETCAQIVKLINANKKYIDNYTSLMQTKYNISNYYSASGNENQQTYNYAFSACLCFVNIAGKCFIYLE